MNDARIETERSIFFNALEIDSETARNEYLTTACAGDSVLRADVDALLHAHEEPQELLDTPIIRGVDTASPHFEAPGEAVGPYRLGRQIGEGSFGIVFLAEQEQPVRRQVALKIIKPGMDTKEVIARFEAEKQALAMMDHPNIARVFDAGITESGRPYVAMELAQGTPITEYCRQNALTLRERLMLFIEVCRAIQHAHQKGIIHRDIKPNNVLVTTLDGKPAAKVIDFGIAKALDHSAIDRTRLTTLNQIVGTPLYMSPEQATLGSLDVDTRTDVYSLGVLLYELLTETTPHEEERLKDVELDEIRRIIREEEPPRPSRRITTLRETAGKLAENAATTRPVPAISADLDWIVMKSLEKDPARRYESAAALASEVERYLLGQPVEAHPPSATYRARKFMRRYRVPVSVAAAMLLMIIAGGVVASMGWVRSAITRRELAVNVGKAERARAVAETESAERRWLLYIAEMALALDVWERGRSERLEAFLRRYLPHEDEEDIRGVEWFYLWRLWKRSVTADYRPFPYQTDWTWQDCSKDGSRLALATANGRPTVVVLDTNTWETIKSFGGRTQRWEGVGMSISPDGRFVVYRGSHQMMLANVDTGEERPIENSSRDGTATFSPDSRTLAVAVGSNIWLWDIDAWKKIDALQGHTRDVLAMKFSPDGKQLASASMDATVRVWDLLDPQKNWVGDGGSADIFSVAYSPNGKFLASGSRDRLVVVWDAEKGKRLETFPGAREEVRVVTFSHDGRLLAAGCRGGMIQLWSVPDFVKQEAIRGYNSLYGLNFLPDGRLVYPGKRCLTIRDERANRSETLSVPASIREIPHRAIPSPAFSSDGKTLVATGIGLPKCISFWRITDGLATPLESLQLEFASSRLAVSSQDLLAVADSDAPSVHLFDLTTREYRRKLLLPRNTQINYLAFSPSGNRLAVGHVDGRVVIWDVDNGKVLMDQSAHGMGSEGLCLSFCGDDKTLVTGGLNGSVRLWDVERGIPLDFVKRQGAIHAVEACADRGILAAGTFVGDIRLYDANTLKEISTLRGHFSAVRGVRILRDGTTLLSAGGDRTVRIWDLVKQKERFAIDIGLGISESMAVSPDEKTIAVGTREGRIHLISVASPEEVEAEPGWRKKPPKHQPTGVSTMQATDSRIAAAQE